MRVARLSLDHGEIPTEPIAGCEPKVVPVNDAYRGRLLRRALRLARFFIGGELEPVAGRESAREAVGDPQERPEVW